MLCIATQKNILPSDLSVLDKTDQDWVKGTTKLSVEAMKCIEFNMVGTAKAMVESDLPLGIVLLQNVSQGDR